MGFANRKRAGSPDGQGPGYQLEDYILARMDLRGLSVRALAADAGIGRNRLHAGLHREADKRIPLRMPETQAILDALGIHPIEALLAINIFETVQDVEFDDLLRVLTMVCGMVKGLPEDIITVVKHVEGLAFEDVRPEHGDAARGLLIKLVTVEYEKVVRRRTGKDAAFGDG